MSMFIGEYQHTMDEKGRVAIPGSFRAAFRAGLVVTRGIDACLFVYTRKRWDQLASQLAKLPMNQAHSRAFARLMLAGAMELRLDSQGRILLPEYLRTFAALTRETVVAGLYDRLELWDKAAWEAYKRATEKDSATIAEQLGNLGIA